MSFQPVSVLRTLARLRPVFHSEADFQFAFAWQIREMYPEWQLRLEYPFGDHVRRALDILLRREEEIGIELKYPTHRLDAVVGGERFRLKEAATDLARYETVRDIGRMESFVAARGNASAFVVVLANHRSLWTDSQRAGKSADFSIHEGRELSGTLAWRQDTAGSTVGRSVTLRGRYRVTWQDYSRVDPEAGYGDFRFTIFEIRRSSPGS